MNDKVTRDLGIIDESAFLQYEARFYFDEVLGTKNDVPLVSTSLDQSYPLWRLPYWKGALVSFVLDGLIQKITVGAHSLDDVLSAIYERYGRMNGLCSNEEIVKVISSVMSFDFKPFFDRYIYGKDRLPLKILAGDLAVDWPELLQGLKLSSFPIMTLTLSDSFPTVGQTVEPTAQLVTIDSEPIANQMITFSLNSTLIGSIATDQSGLATLIFNVEVNRGTYRLVASYAGSSLFSPTEESATLAVLPGEAPAAGTTTSMSTTEVSASTVQVAWLQMDWLYLVLAVVVRAIAVVLVSRRPRSTHTK